MAALGRSWYNGGYDGQAPRREIYATTDGRRFDQVGTLPVGLRYAAVASDGGALSVSPYTGEPLGREQLSAGGYFGPVQSCTRVQIAKIVRGSDANTKFTFLYNRLLGITNTAVKTHNHSEDGG